MGNGAGRKNGLGAYVLYDCVILTEVRFIYVGAVSALLSDLTA